MKSLLIVLLLCALLGAALFCPIAGRSFWQRAQAHGIPAAMARGAAHGLRAGWDLLAELGQHARTSGVGETRKPPAYSPRHPSRKAQAQAAAAQPARRTSREGIVPQQPKENLESSDRAALDALLSKPR